MDDTDGSRGGTGYLSIGDLYNLDSKKPQKGWARGAATGAARFLSSRCQYEIPQPAIT
jgi:hypothetical protein